ncbi:conserved hypothetical protein [Alteromonas sp. 38]|uniref:PulJ/GspJ family protein n=1 Tax=Alteromonas TaxID=226 RepID=UPI0012F1E5A4|nr:MULTISPECIES: prepilin-type N-terminal cleavage/methylation domain-containing protein [Alteromonas]CAD5266238.1 conserved hypothetical protein [Alteromonas sp. 154]VXC07118.1 conserved hypothetical protein [Alteromonas sp. 38]
MTSIKLTKGFSLIEVIIASGLFALTFTAGLKLYQQIFGQWQQLRAVQQARHQLEIAQTDLLINVNTNPNSYVTITPSYSTSVAKAVILEQIIEPLPKLPHTEEALNTEEEVNVEGTLDEVQGLTEKEKLESQVITQQLTFIVAPPYQSSWQDVVSMGPLVPLSPAKP